MINVYIVSGFLGSGKTTFIQKLLKEKKFEKVMLLENEFGEVGVDASFFDSSLKVKEINNGCICCSLQGDFSDALEEIENMGVSDLIIEPSGVGKLSEIINVVSKDEDFRIVSHICIVDVKTCVKYHRNFKDYFDDQVVSANSIILSHLDVCNEEEKNKAIELIKEINSDADITLKPIDEMDINILMDIIVKDGEICLECIEEEHHHHHDDEDECDFECEEHHHHHHDEDECDCDCQEHHHDHKGEVHHGHHHHHHDDDTFSNVVIEPNYIFNKDEIENILNNIDEDIIRVKGWVNTKDGTLYLNYVLNEYNVFYGEHKDSSLISIIGTVLDEKKLTEVFHG